MILFGLLRKLCIYVFWTVQAKFTLNSANKNLLFDELLEIDPVDIRLNNSLESFEDELLSRLNKEDIVKFVDQLRKDLE